ncbi:MAG: acetyl-CoA synthase subunit gamma [Clostridia bacterium]|nr:acetyl-CoA synthase subunit gamma [Clostridia bacterium]
MDVKASRFDAFSIMFEVSGIKREVVSDRYIKHIVSEQKVDQKFYLKDHLWNIGVRCNINRDHYKIPTGLYQFGSPDENSKVLVTGNYKLTFDYLRKYLKKNYWVLVIDTDGINVWCAAGKGRFGTAEVIRMLKSVEIPVSHNEIILPQLSGPGIQSHLITQVTGKKVIFGPVRIEDMDTFITDGMHESMRQVNFNLKDRLLLLPVEIVSSFKYLLVALILSFVPGLPKETFWIFLVASILGNVIHPIFLPIMPFRKFYLNGFLLSLVLLLFLITNLNALGVILFGMLYTSFLTMSFTGSTTFTSLTGVKAEMDEAVPFMIKWGILAFIITTINILREVL